MFEVCLWFPKSLQAGAVVLESTIFSFHFHDILSLYTVGSSIE
jgi:hypothetical protein